MDIYIYKVSRSASETIVVAAASEDDARDQLRIWEDAAFHESHVSKITDLYFVAKSKDDLDCLPDDDKDKIATKVVYGDTHEIGRYLGKDVTKLTCEDVLGMDNRSDIENLCISAVRYSLGRSTYITDDTCRIVSKHIQNMQTTVLSVLYKDIEKYLTARVPSSLDVPYWKTLGDRLRAELEKRKPTCE